MVQFVSIEVYVSYRNRKTLVSVGTIVPWALRGWSIRGNDPKTSNIFNGRGNGVSAESFQIFLRVLP